MSTLIYEFSILEPVSNNEEFVKKVKEPLYPTVLSILSLKRWMAMYYLSEFAKRGDFKNSGRYRLEITLVRIFWVNARLIQII